MIDFGNKIKFQCADKYGCELNNNKKGLASFRCYDNCDAIDPDQ